MGGQILQKLSRPNLNITSPKSYSSHLLQCTCHEGMERHNLVRDNFRVNDIGREAYGAEHLSITSAKAVHSCWLNIQLIL